MPIISMFYGIIIRMYLIDNRHHNLPHIHAKYAEFEASISIEDGEILAWISTAGKALMIAVRNTGFFLENTIRFVNPDYTDGEVCLTATCCRRRSIAEQFRDLTERSLLDVRSSLEPKAHDLIEISAP
jgi:hypothetical protein